LKHEIDREDEWEQEREIDGEDEWEQVGVIGVDSGYVLLCDPCYLGEVASIDRDFIFDVLPLGVTKLQLDYDSGDDARYSYRNIGAGDEGAGFVVSTWIGDGLYPVYVRTDGSRITELRIDFVEPWRKLSLNRASKNDNGKHTLL
jgi:hypothetical protein